MSDLTPDQRTELRERIALTLLRERGYPHDGEGEKELIREASAIEAWIVGDAPAPESATEGPASFRYTGVAKETDVPWIIDPAPARPSEAIRPRDWIVRGTGHIACGLRPTRMVRDPGRPSIVICTFDMPGADEHTLRILTATADEHVAGLVYDPLPDQRDPGDETDGGRRA